MYNIGIKYFTNTYIMALFNIKQSKKLNLTSHAGLALIGQCCELAQIDKILDTNIPASSGLKTSEIAKSMIGLLSIGKSDFEAIESFRENSFYKKALGVRKVCSSAWLRQKMDGLAVKLVKCADELSVNLLERAKAPVTAHRGYVGLDMDTFVMDQSGSHKENVSRTYQGVDGYTPMAAYLGNEGWCIGLQLRPGKQHSALNTELFLNDIFPRVERLTSQAQHVLSRLDSGFDSVGLLFAHANEKNRLAALKRLFDFIIKWNPRKQDKALWLKRAEDSGTFKEIRPGKRQALFSMQVERAWKKEKRTFRLVVRVTERTIDKKGQQLLIPDIELEGWWTSLAVHESEVIELYKDHGTHEQFHSEIKTDLDLERLPSGKFATNNAILHLGMFVYNCLRLLGQLGLTGEISPVRHPAKRRRLKTVLQEIMFRAAQFIDHARKLVLDFGRGWAEHVKVFADLQDTLIMARSP